MRIRVKLFGSLGRGYPGYHPEHGMKIEMPDDARAEDLIARLNIHKSQKWMVVTDGRIMKADSALKDGACAHVIPAVFGG